MPPTRPATDEWQTPPPQKRCATASPSSLLRLETEAPLSSLAARHWSNDDPRPQAIDLAVGHVRQPCQRMPVADFAIGQRPNGSLEGQTLCHYWVVIDIFVVIVIDEFVMQRLSENGKGHRGQHQADPRHLPA